MPLPQQVLQTSYCTHLFYNNVIQTVLGVGTDMIVTADVYLCHVYKVYYKMYVT